MQKAKINGDKYSGKRGQVNMKKTTAGDVTVDCRQSCLSQGQLNSVH
jgi:hypothetical protein